MTASSTSLPVCSAEHEKPCLIQPPMLRCMMLQPQSGIDSILFTHKFCLQVQQVSSSAATINPINQSKPHGACIPQKDMLDNTAISSELTESHLLMTNAGQLASQPDASVLVLCDAADPGFPSFPVIRASHFHHFERLLPPDFVNQDGDPFLMELYRCTGGVSDCMDVTVTNLRGKMTSLLSRPQKQAGTGRDSVSHAHACGTCLHNRAS